MEEIVYWAHLAGIEGVGGAIFDQLLKRFGSIKRALEAPFHEVKEIPGLDDRTAEAICRAHQTLESTRATIEELAGKGIRFITKLDAAYPPRLREASNPPPLLYQIGELQPKDDRAVAIIGSRDCSEVSRRRAGEYAQYFAQQGLAVVSGYAPGVDTSAHLGALEAGGRTVIIPGCGLGYFDLSPLQPLNINSLDDLVKKAVVISEQPPASDWSAQGSLARNRLVAAQARAVLVIEARMHSSTLDTVSRAQSLNRPIFTQGFASVSERTMGNEWLRQQGAREVQSTADLEQISDLLKGKEGPDQEVPRADDSRR